MALLTTISGIDIVLRNLKKSRGTIGTSVAKGLKRGALLLQRESMKIVPVDTNILRAGAFNRNIGGEGFDTDMMVGYQAEYAVYVHEDLEARHKTGKQAKYLEAPARQFRPDILKIIAEEGSKI